MDNQMSGVSDTPLQNALTPEGAWLRSDVTLLREGLQNIKGIIYSSGVTENKGKLELGDCVQMLQRIYDECDRILWGIEEMKNE